jgi:hypothetical protein
MMPMTLTPHLPTKPVAAVHDSSDYGLWHDAGATAAPAGLSSGLFPGAETSPAPHILFHPAPDLHIAL